MSSDNKNIIYTAADIEQYFAGKLSSQQMHQLEKAALDDPFLAEAMEGYEGIKAAAWKNQLVALHEQVEAKGTVAKVIPLHKTKNNWWKAAAAILILGAGATLTFILSKDEPETEKTNQQIAQTITAEKDTVHEKEVPVSVTKSINPTASDTKEETKTVSGLVSKPQAAGNATEYQYTQTDAAQIKTTEPLTVTSANETESKNATAAAPVNNAVENNNGLINEETINPNRKQTAKANNSVEELSRQKNQGFANDKKEATLNNYFTAQVVGADNSPLPFTNISIKKENFGTYADAKGMVRLVSSDSILFVDVKSVGYLPKTFTLRNNQAQTKIVLQEDEFVGKDKTVIGKRDMAAPQKSRRATLLTDSIINVEPADGWENYNTYVANNLDIPDEMLNKDFHGAVELSFDVKPNGTISNVRVNKSLGAAYDEAAKRLILEGPQWKVKKGKKTSANIKVQF